MTMISDFVSRASGIGKDVDRYAPNVASIRIFTSTYGRPIPLCYGQVKIAGNLLWHLEQAQFDYLRGNPTGIKNVGNIIGFCEGPITCLKRGWSQKYFYQDFGVSVLTTLGWPLFTLGSYAQLPPSQMMFWFPPIPYMAYRGLAYLRTENPAPINDTSEPPEITAEIATTIQVGKIASLAKTVTVDPVTDIFTCNAHGFTEGMAINFTTSGVLPSVAEQIGNYFSLIDVKVFSDFYSVLATVPYDYYVTNVTANTFQIKYNSWDSFTIDVTSAGTGTLTATPTLLDANPKDIVTDILSNDKSALGGLGVSLGDLTAFGTYCLASGSLASPSIETQESAIEIFRRLAIIGFSGMFWSERVLKIAPYCDTAITGNGVTFTPITTAVYALTDDDFIIESENADPVQVTRIAPSDVYNSVTIEYENRLNQYVYETVEVRDDDAISKYGFRAKDKIVLHEIKDPTIAKWVASLILFREQNVRASYKFRLPSKFILLEQMDIVTLTESTGTPLSNVPVRITLIEEQDDGSFVITAEQYPSGTSVGVKFKTQTGSAFLPYLNDTQDVNDPVLFVAPLALTKSVLEVFAAVSAQTISYGGSDVWTALDDPNGHYAFAGSQAGKSRTGFLNGLFAARSGLDNVSKVSVDLFESNGFMRSVTADQAFRGDQSLCYVNGEIFSYTKALGRTAYLNLPGSSGNYASTMDSADNSITGDIDIIAKAALTDWTPPVNQVLAAKSMGAGDNSYILRVQTDGKLALFTSNDGTSTPVQAVSSVATGFSDGSLHFVRVTLDVNNGAGGNDAKFYTSDDYDPDTGDGTWTQLGTTVTTSGTTSIFDGTAPLEVGARIGGTTEPLAGKIYYAEIRNGIDGPAAASFDPRDLAPGATRGASSRTKEGWTINQSGSPPAFIQQEVCENWQLRLPGVTGNYASTPDTALNSITGDIDIRVRLANELPTTENAFIAKQGSGGTQDSWYFRPTGVGGLPGVKWLWTTDGVHSGGNSHEAASTAGHAYGTNPFWIRITHDVNNGAGGNDVKFYTSNDYDPDTNTGTWTQLGTTVTGAFTTSIFDSNAPIEIGSRALGAIATFVGRIYYAEIRNGINGSLASVFDAREAASRGALSWASKLGEAWTVNQSGDDVAKILVGNLYTLDTLYRGKCNTTPDAGALGDRFAVIGDSSVLKIPFAPEFSDGHTMYLKLLERNAISGSVQNLNEVSPYAIALQPPSAMLDERAMFGNWATANFSTGTVSSGLFWSAFFDSTGTAPFKFIIAGIAQLWTSNDALTWVVQTLPIALNILGIAWSPSLGMYVVVTQKDQASNKACIFTSTDGVTWNQQTNPLAAVAAADSQNLRSVIWSSELATFVIVGYEQIVAGNIDNARILTSTNGTAWTSRTPAVKSLLNAVSWSAARSLFAACGDSGQTGQGVTSIQTSPDGSNWSSQTVPLVLPRGSPTLRPQALRSILYGGSQFVCVGADGGGGPIFLTSPDAITWTPQFDIDPFIDFSGGGTNQFFVESVCWSGAYYVSTGWFGSGGAGTGVAFSSDGKAWSYKGGLQELCLSIVFAEHFYLACGGNNSNAHPYAATSLRR